VENTVKDVISTASEVANQAGKYLNKPQTIPVKEIVSTLEPIVNDLVKNFDQDDAPKFVQDLIPTVNHLVSWIKGLISDGGKDDDDDQTIVEIAVGKPDTFSTLVAALKAADLVDVLSGPGPFTVFAPTNAAFAKLGDAVTDLLKPENKDQLVALLEYHVVAAKILSTDLLVSLRAATLEGADIEITSLTPPTIKVSYSPLGTPSPYPPRTSPLSAFVCVHSSEHMSKGPYIKLYLCPPPRHRHDTRECLVPTARRPAGHLAPEVARRRREQHARDVRLARGRRRRCLALPRLDEARPKTA